MDTLTFPRWHARQRLEIARSCAKRAMENADLMLFNGDLTINNRDFMGCICILYYLLYIYICNLIYIYIYIYMYKWGRDTSKKTWKTHGERPSENDLQMVGNLHGASSRCSIRCWEMWKKWRGIGIELPGYHYYFIIFYYILYFYITLYYTILYYSIL